MKIRHLFVWLFGSLILSPILVLFLSASFWGFVLSFVYAAVIVYSIKPFGRFWESWWRINCYFASILDGKDLSTK